MSTTTLEREGYIEVVPRLKLCNFEAAMNVTFMTPNSFRNWNIKRILGCGNVKRTPNRRRKVVEKEQTLILPYHTQNKSKGKK